MSVRRGFTLLELMLIMLLIGILASTVVLSFNSDSAQEQVNKEALRFQQVFHFIAETAQLRQQEWGLLVAEKSYAFVYFKDNKWHWVEEPVAAAVYELPEGVSLQLELEGLPGFEQNLLSQLQWEMEEQAVLADKANAERPPLPRVFILSSGEITPFRLSLKASEGLTVFQVQLGTDFGIPLKRYTMGDD